MVSQLEQAKTAAEALVSMGLIQDEERGQIPLDEEDTGTLFLSLADKPVQKNSKETATNTKLNDSDVIEPLPLTESSESFEADPEEDQAIPVTDDASPSDYFSTGIRCPKFLRGWKETGFAFKTLQKSLYWKSEEGEVKLTCRLCNHIFDANCPIKNHLKEHLDSSCHSQNKIDKSDQNSCETIGNREQGTNTLKSRFKRQFCPWYQCSFCSERLKSKHDLKEHLQAYHATNTKCESCGHEASDVCDAILHRQRCIEIRKARQWECHKCLEIFFTEEELKVCEKI